MTTPADKKRQSEAIEALLTEFKNKGGRIEVIRLSEREMPQPQKKLLAARFKLPTTKIRESDQ